MVRVGTTPVDLSDTSQKLHCKRYPSSVLGNVEKQSSTFLSLVIILHCWFCLQFLVMTAGVLSE